MASNKPTQQQIMLAWEHLDLSRTFFFCMAQRDDQPPIVLSGHRSLTSALHRNGNMARNWKQEEGGIAEEKTFGKARWLLNVNGVRIRLFVKYFDRDEPAPIDIEDTPVEHEEGVRGRSERLLKIASNWGARV